MNVKLILLVGIVIVILAYLGILITGRMKNYVDGFTGLAPKTNSFTLYYMNGCPHCESILPSYKKFVSAGQLVENGTKTQIRMLEQGDPDAAPEIEANNVKGFPTFIMVTAAGDTLEYKGDRTVPAITEFIKQNAS